MPRSAAAFLPPAFIASKYGMPWSLGTKATLTLSPEPPVLPAESDSFFFVQPVSASAAVRPSATTVVILRVERMGAPVRPPRRGLRATAEGRAGPGGRRMVQARCNDSFRDRHVNQVTVECQRV